MEQFTRRAIANDAIGENQIDFGLSAEQVSAVDIPVLDDAGLFTATEIESALYQIMTVAQSAGSPIKQEVLTLSAGDISAGFKACVNKASGVAGEKTNVQVTPAGFGDQFYGTSFTAMNNDANTALIIIWKTSEAVTGIASPVYPTVGMQGTSGLAENDKLKVIYE
jgi:hypothetical protein